MGCSAQIERERWHIICERRKSTGYALRMGNSVYAIDASLHQALKSSLFGPIELDCRRTGAPSNEKSTIGPR
jgi:hypothetical protein